MQPSQDNNDQSQDRSLFENTPDYLQSNPISSVNLSATAKTAQQDFSNKGAQQSLQNSTALPYAVPDYLGIVPTEDPIQVELLKRSKRKRVVLSIAALFIGLIGCATGYWLYQQNSPQSKISKLLIAQAAPGYINREITVVPTQSKHKLRLVVKAESDFSDISSPKTAFAYSLSDNDKIVAGGRVIYLSKDSIFGLISTETSFSKNAKLSIDKWYKAEISRYLFRTIFDYNRMAEQLSVPLDLLGIRGNGDDVRTDFISTLRDSGYFDIKSLTGDKDGDLYTLTVRPTELYDLYSKYSKGQGVSMVAKGLYLSIANIASDIKVQTDSTNSRLSRVEYAARAGESDATLHITIKYSYPNSMNIQQPKEYKVLRLQEEVN